MICWLLAGANPHHPIDVVNTTAASLSLVLVAPPAAVRCPPAARAGLLFMEEEPEAAPPPAPPPPPDTNYYTMGYKLEGAPFGTEPPYYNGNNMRERMIDYINRSPGMANIGCYATFRPEMIAVFNEAMKDGDPKMMDDERVVDQNPLARMGAGGAATPKGEVPLEALMKITGEELEEAELNKLLEYVAYPAGKKVAFEKWSKIMMDAAQGKVAEEKGEEKKTGFFGLF